MCVCVQRRVELNESRMMATNKGCWQQQQVLPLKDIIRSFTLQGQSTLQVVFFMKYTK